MKKLLACLAISATLLCGGVTVVASAQTYNAPQTECDQVFAATVGELVESQSNSLNAVRKTLYDIQINPLGFVYEFTADEADGYAVYLWENEKFIPQEVITNGSSPYAEAEGKCVYVCSYTYLEYVNGEYADLNNGVTLSADAVGLMAENAVYGNVGIMPLAATIVTVSFESKDKHEYLMSIQPPTINSSPYTSACACIAGANIITYYDRYYPNLIADYEPGYWFMDVLYLYYTQSSKTIAVGSQLYSDMGTTSQGTTQTQFVNGMKKYCNRAGYSFGYTSVMSGGKINYSEAIKQMEQNNRPLALFLSGYNVTRVINEWDSKDEYSYYYETANHVMVGFGYRYITYTYSNSTTETYNFIYVSSGSGNALDGFFNVNFSGNTINDALAINIY